jgi:hypothetical protein
VIFICHKQKVFICLLATGIELLPRSASGAQDEQLPAPHQDTYGTTEQLDHTFEFRGDARLNLEECARIPRISYGRAIKPSLNPLS